MYIRFIGKYFNYQGQDKCLGKHILILLALISLVQPASLDTLALAQKSPADSINMSQGAVNIRSPLSGAVSVDTLLSTKVFSPDTTIQIVPENTDRNLIISPSNSDTSHFGSRKLGSTENSIPSGPHLTNNELEKTDSSSRKGKKPQSSKIIKATPGYISAKQLPSSYQGRIDSIRYVIYDAMDGSTTYSEAEEHLRNLGNFLHIESKPSTIQKRVLFKKGQVVTRNLLLETERKLRREVFLADATIEVDTSRTGLCRIVVHTFDQWTTNLSFNPKYSGKEFTWWMAVVESNVLGSGQQTGFGYTDDLDRNTFWMLYRNHAFFYTGQMFSFNGGKSSDGYFLESDLGVPLSSKSQKWAYAFRNSYLKSDRYFYLDANRLNDIGQFAKTFPDSVLKVSSNSTNQLIKYTDVHSLRSSFSLTRSFGQTFKSNISWATELSELYRSSFQDQFLGRYIFDAQDYNLGLPLRKNVRSGFYLTISKTDYQTVTNFRNLKWQEDLDLGFKLSQGVLLQARTFGSSRTGLALYHGINWISSPVAGQYLSMDASSTYLLVDNLQASEGNLNNQLSYQIKKPGGFTTVYNQEVKSYFASEASLQNLLGEENGFNGYPNRFFAGRSSVLLSLEERYFPPFEFGTLVPALAVFVNAGNAFPALDKINPSDLHYSAGVGLRLGASRTIQKVVNHLNLTFPLDKKYYRELGWQINLRATQGL